MDRRGDRGQIIIVVALVLATVLVALALILNSAIYTENLSTRETTDSGDVAAEFDTRFAEVADALTYVNTHHDDSAGTIDENFTAIADRWASDVSGQYAMGGAAVSVTVDETAAGTVIRQDDASRNFTADGSSDPEWTLADGVDELSGFEMTVTRDELAENHDDAFNVTLNGSSKAWSVYVFNGTTDDEIVVFSGLEQNVDPDANRCEIEATDATLDFADQALVGADGTIVDCPALAVDDKLNGSVAVEYGNGDAAVGTYELFVDGDATITDEEFADRPDSPYTTDAIVDADVTVTFHRSDVRHAQSRTVRAGGLVYRA